MRLYVKIYFHLFLILLFISCNEEKTINKGEVDPSKLDHKFTVNTAAQNLTAKVLGWTIPIR